MNVIMFDHDCREQLYPLTEIRPAGEIRIGITTIREKWKTFINGNFSYLAADYLSERYPTHIEAENLFIAANVIPTANFVQAITALKPTEGIEYNGRLVAYCGGVDDFKADTPKQTLSYTDELIVVEYAYDIFRLNDPALKLDFLRITHGHESQPLSPSNQVIGSRDMIFLEEGAKMECCILNTTHGPIYIGRDTEVMEGSMIRGPFGAGEKCVINMGSKIYGATTLGPYCKIGGELNNVVIMAYSNKAHDGFLGNAIVGQWCNIGAGTNASNLKNDYSEVKLWNNAVGRFQKTGLMFCGLVMGDYSRIGVNVMLNTATMIGVGCSVYGSGFPRNLVASFLDGGAAGFDKVNFKSFISTMEVMMARRNYTLSDAEKRVCETLFDQAV